VLPFFFYNIDIASSQTYDYEDPTMHGQDEFLFPAKLSEEEKKVLIQNSSGNEWGENSIDGGGGVSCFDYYTFQSVQVSVGIDKNSYSPGEFVKFSGELVNKNNYPVVDGYVFVRISRENTNQNHILEWHNISDEFFGAEKTVIDANGIKNIQFTWEVPDSLQGGRYRADYFFSVGKKFNLGGLPFSNEIMVGTAKFNIESEDYSIYLDRSGTKINGTEYKHIGNWPIVDENSQVIITQPVNNPTETEQDVDVSYELYWWDGLLEGDMIDIKKEQIKIPANSSLDLSYELPNIVEPVYYLKITAESGNQKSIVNLSMGLCL